MNFQLSKYSFIGPSCFLQLILILMHIVTSNILIYYLLLCFIPINIFLVFFLKKINKKELAFILTFILFSLVFGIFSPASFNELFVSWFMLVYSISFSILFFNIKSINYILVFLFFLNLYVLYLAFINNFNPDFGNDIFVNKSRNYVSATLSIFSILYLTLVRYFNQKINLLVLTLLSINCFFLYGRSGIVVGLLLLLFGVYYKFGLRFFIFLSLVTSVFLGAIFYYISTQTNFGDGLDTPRYALAQEYFDYIANDSYSLFFGANLTNCCTLIASYGFNPHNSFLMGHSIYGLFVLIFLIISFFIVVISKRVDFLFLYLIIILRYYLDSIGIFTYFDVVLFLLLYACYMGRLNKEEVYVK